MEARIFKKRVNEFVDWKSKGHKEYTSTDEDVYRLSVFIHNEEDIENFMQEHANDENKVVLAVNKFSD